MKKAGSEIWAIIPARGGSKSIPHKNIALLNNRPLIEYVINTAQKSKNIDKTICSTDDMKIKQVCLENNIVVHDRPKQLGEDSTHVINVIIELLNEWGKRGQLLPFAIVLLQPTSPFVLPEHIQMCVEALIHDHKALSSQTISLLPHHYHAYNQREVDNGYVNFRFMRQRRIGYNKQTKPVFYAFGNLVVTKTDALLRKKEVFATPSIPCEIERKYAIDVDGPEDLELAEYMLRERKVVLPHMGS